MFSLTVNEIKMFFELIEKESGQHGWVDPGAMYTLRTGNRVQLGPLQAKLSILLEMASRKESASA